VKQNASQVARTPGAVCGKSFFGMRIKPAGEGVPLNGSIELLSVEGRKPGAKARQLVRGKLFDGFFDVFGGGHV
jgi:hypothetical protein